MEERIRQTAGEEVPGQRIESSWPFRTACMYYIRINWAPPRGATPPRLYSPSLLIVRRQKAVRPKPYLPYRPRRPWILVVAGYSNCFVLGLFLSQHSHYNIKQLETPNLFKNVSSLVAHHTQTTIMVPPCCHLKTCSLASWGLMTSGHREWWCGEVQLSWTIAHL